MKLYIETENGQFKNHPALEENLLQVFGKVPTNWVFFERVEKPQLGVYEVFVQEEPEYQLVDGVYKDVWLVRPMNEIEKEAKQQYTKDLWAKLPNFENCTAWVFDESVCSYIPPFPRPNDGKLYRWDGTLNSWVELSAPIEI